MREMLLLGAGATIEAGVPGAYRMTEKIVERFASDPIHRSRRYSHVLNFVVGGLLFNEGQRGNNPFASGVNVEDLFNAVILLAERNTLEATPFVAWHAMVEELDKIHPPRQNQNRLTTLIYENVAKQILGALSQNAPSAKADKIDKALEVNIKKRVEAMLAKRSSVSISSSESIGHAVSEYVSETARKWSDKLNNATAKSGADFDKEFSRAVDERQSRPGGGRRFQRTAEAMILTLKDMVWIDDAERVAYLRPLLNLVRAQDRLVVATLNYDNGVELMASANDIVCNTGIDHWSKEGTFDYSSTGLHLIKLHGSIDWTWQQGATHTERPMPHSIIRRIDFQTGKESYERPAVVFGQRNKLTAEGPFLDLLRAFQNELAASSVLTVIGYSFRDAHINTYISHWLNQSADNRIQIVDPSFESSSVEYVGQLKRLRQTRSAQVAVIRDGAGTALPGLYPEVASTLPFMDKPHGEEIQT